MASFTGGQKLRASELNSALPLFGLVTVASSKTSNTTMGDITGMSVTVSANTLYAMDGYIAYVSNATADLKIAITVPASTTGHWALNSVVTGSTGGQGDLNAIRLDAFGDASTITAGGSDAGSSTVACAPCGYIAVAATAGTLQFRFAQNTSNGTATQIIAGSWVRLVEVG